MSIKKTVLQGIAKSSGYVAQEACGLKSIFVFFEPEVPQKLKERKMKNK